MLSPVPIAKLICRYAIASLDRQLYFHAVAGENDWGFDWSLSPLFFGQHQRFAAVPLGTESEASSTWLWAWANTASNIPAHLLVASLALKAYGEQHGISELTTPELPLDQVDPHALALLASGVCEANAYYRCPYEGGALYVLITDENFPKCPDPPLQRIATVFPQAIASLDIPDHRLALTGYLDHYGLAHVSEGDTVVVREGGEPVLTATFDGQNRLTHLEVKLESPAASPSDAHPIADPAGPSWNDQQLRRMLGG